MSEQTLTLSPLQEAVKKFSLETVVSNLSNELLPLAIAQMIAQEPKDSELRQVVTLQFLSFFVKKNFYPSAPGSIDVLYPEFNDYWHFVAVGDKPPYRYLVVSHNANRNQIDAEVEALYGRKSPTERWSWFIPYSQE